MLTCCTLMTLRNTLRLKKMRGFGREVGVNGNLKRLGERREYGDYHYYYTENSRRFTERFSIS